MKHSFTDEQLLSLVNNTIRTKTEHDISEFTGGSVQITSTNNHQLMKFKVSLFFGYKQKNPIARTIDINENLVSIWMDAIQLKCKAMQVSNNGMDYSDLNALMNNISNEVVSNIVDSKEVVSISRGITTPLTTSSNTNISTKSEKYPSDFLEFWSLYPRKEGKDKALTSWTKKKDKPSLQNILEAVQRYKLSKTVRDGYICLPTTWINEGRWHDEVTLSDYDKAKAIQEHTGMSAADTLAIQIEAEQRKWEAENGGMR